MIVTTALPLATPRATHRAVVVSDSELLCTGLREAVGDTLEIVADVPDLARAEAAVQTAHAHVVIAAPTDGGDDAHFAGLAGLDGDRRVLLLLPPAGFRIHASSLRRRHDFACLPLNADGPSIRRAIGGLLSSGSEVTLEHVVSGGRGTLTPREQEVLSELARGLTNRQIAERLWVSQDTVKSHLRRVFRKLEVATRTEAVAAYLAELRA
ncbi:MAG: response regulator transcription factor [Solirubrobacteraceae bacterium]|nr:response regulator transcription factor [Solirubrobacteraceae bacterium]